MAFSGYQRNLLDFDRVFSQTSLVLEKVELEGGRGSELPAAALFVEKKSQIEP